MNRCQMSNNNINSSAPSSPTGTVAANNNTTDPQPTTDNQQPRLSRSRSLSDISQGDSPSQGDQQQHQQTTQSQHTQKQGHQQPKLRLLTQTTPDSLKVKIKTKNILNNNNNNNNNNSNKSDSTLEEESSSLTTATTTINTPTTNNNTIKQSIEGTSNKTENDSNNIATKSNSSTTTNGGYNSIDSDKTFDNSANLLSKNTSVTNKPKNAEVNMNNHGASISTAENGKSSASPQQLQPPFAQPTQSSQQTPLPPPPSPTHQQNPLLSPQPLPPPPPAASGQSSSKSTPQKSPATSQKSTTPESKKSTSTTASPVEPKPKTTRTRKQPAASNKGANATPKPAPKPRSKKAKQDAENAATTSVPSTQPLPPISAAISTPASTLDNKNASNLQQPPVPQTKKRKPRGATANSTALAAAAGASKIETNLPAASPPKRTRKKKGEPTPNSADKNNNPPPPPHPPHPMIASNITLPPLNIANPQLLSVASNVPMGHSPLMSNAPLPPLQQTNINRQIPNMPLDAHDPARYYQLTISPYANYDHGNAASLTRPSLSRLFTSSAASSEAVGNSNSHSEELAKAFDELRDNTWTNLSKCILDQASQFDIPSLIATLYHLRQENDKLMNKVRDLTQKRDQLIAMNARLELPETRLIPHLNHTSPNFSAIVGITNSPRSLPNSSPSPAMNKSPIIPGSSYNVQTANSLGPPGFIDRSSPLVGLPTPHSGVNSLKTSTMSTPSPPTSAMMAHVANNRAGLMTVNPPYMPNVHPSINAMNPHVGVNPPGSSYYPRQ